MYKLDATRVRFPSPADIRSAPTDLIAVDGNLEPDTLLGAYKRSLFPWYSHGQPILWHSPDPRAVLKPGKIHISRSLEKKLKSGRFSLTLNYRFAEVINQCANRHGDTWITTEMESAYKHLHQEGHAHSIEVTENETLVGGLYGVAIGRMFFGESMFSLRTDASKVALVVLSRYLKEHHFPLIDCQVHSTHLESLGAQLLSRAEFMRQIDELCKREPPKPMWMQQELDGYL